MKKNLGLILLLVVACLATYIVNDRFLHPANLENLLRRTALFSLISIGVSLVITTGGIDLSIGSVVCLTGTLLPWLAVSQGWTWPSAAAALFCGAGALGMMHGLLVTRLTLQPFIVTLCGLLLYRGVTRGITADQTQGFGVGFEGLRAITQTRITLGDTLPVAIPSVALITLVVAMAAALLINYTPFGIHLKAVGRSEVAARYSGINTRRVIVLSYVASALLAGLGGMLFILDVNSAQPSDFGNFYELYAIAAAVLGGCSLRGGEWSIVGIVIGTVLMQVLRNAIVLVDIPTQLEFAIIGAVILLGVATEELVRSKWASSSLGRKSPPPT
jgi:ribose transport system permease protein